MEKDIAEFIGIMLGDGSIGIYDTKAKDKIKRQYVVKVTLDSRNKDYVDYVFNLMKKVLRVEPRIHSKKNENTTDIRVFSRDKVLFALEEIGLKKSPKWGKMEIPERFMKEKFYPFLLRGLFDTDGCLSTFNNNGKIYPRIEIKICPSPAQTQFVEIIKFLGFNYKIQNLDKGKIRIRISGVNELEKWFDAVGSSNKKHMDKSRIFLDS